MRTGRPNSLYGRQHCRLLPRPQCPRPHRRIPRRILPPPPPAAAGHRLVLLDAGRHLPHAPPPADPGGATAQPPNAGLPPTSCRRCRPPPVAPTTVRAQLLAVTAICPTAIRRTPLPGPRHPSRRPPLVADYHPSPPIDLRRPLTSDPSLSSLQQ
ncbi:hypothetical protein GUJ93_ZPchr0003g18360 [Zizania palustris]|uniref:Uncharacterized protein n=1 Tax=Zizania palustris TaxID=103762 RepID=A0A8J5STN5_ZIZPA|nr:hypothetical protein GUJ93_ZPchr0003g18360 [Zizania palustris]